ncbi:hypothetical protein AB833_15215 [Chromatiales bacterium (ex Bugula neritina AB1)]|nr:hypothetical protein AB833_15215 [Chromatiales bacterium (ex Bugula neritina AB1)]
MKHGGTSIESDYQWSPTNDAPFFTLVLHKIRVQKLIELYKKALHGVFTGLSLVIPSDIQ